MNEREIRPEALLKQCIELSASGATKCFGDDSRAPVACVGCGGTDDVFQFEKTGLRTFDASPAAPCS